MGLVVVWWWQVLFVGRMVMFLILPHWRQKVLCRRAIVIWLSICGTHMSLMVVWWW